MMLPPKALSVPLPARCCFSCCHASGGPAPGTSCAGSPSRSPAPAATCS